MAKKQPLTGLELISTPKQKLTLLCLGGYESRTHIITRGYVSSDRGAVLAYSEARKKKMFCLATSMQRGAILLNGHIDKSDRPLLEAEVIYNNSSSHVIDGVGGRLIDHKKEGADAVINYLKERAVAHTLHSASKLRLVSEFRDEVTRERTIIEGPSFHEKILAAMGPSLDLGQPAPPTVSRVSLLTDSQRAELLKRGAEDAERISKAEEPAEPQPLVKIFAPGGAGTWLLCSMESDGDTLWAVCDLGMGYVEYGTVSLKELETTRSGVLRSHMERDRHFDGSKLVVTDLLSKNSLSL